jgi:lipopolysaccharide transport system ATP-binding protein
MAHIVVFEQVSRTFRLHQDRPRSLRELFVGGLRLADRATAARPDLLWALRDVSFAIEPGETVGLIGANGAGKSTALKLMSRVIVPTAGRVEVTGRVAALLELGTGFHPDLSGRDNIFLAGALAGMSRAAMARKYAPIVAFAELEHFVDMPVKHYSSGMFARLAFAVSIHLDPEVLLVDEVLAVGDQAFQRRCLDRIADLQRQGVTICFVSHAPDTVREVCTRALWFDHGRLVADGPVAAVVSRYLDHSFSSAGRAGLEPAALGPEQRWGSRRVAIERVRLLDEHGLLQPVFETGRPLRLELDYWAPEPVTDVVFGMALQRHDGVHISGPNTHFAGLALPPLHGRGTVVYTVPSLPLLDGRYDVSVSAHNVSDTEMFDYHDRAYSFRVAQRGAGARERYGFITLRGEWQLIPRPQAELNPAVPADRAP